MKPADEDYDQEHWHRVKNVQWPLMHPQISRGTLAELNDLDNRPDGD